MDKKISEYEQQAQDFLKQTETLMTVEKQGIREFFSDDGVKREVYVITLKRGEHSYPFEFGQSIMNSGRYHLVSGRGYDKRIREISNESKFSFSASPNGTWWEKNKKRCQPTAYDVLAALQKYEPESSFDDFVSEFGYEFSTEKEYFRIKQTHQAVKDEYMMVLTLWNEQEREQLQEIN